MKQQYSRNYIKLDVVFDRESSTELVSNPLPLDESKDFRPFFYRYIDYLDRKQRTIHRPQCFLLISAVSTLKRVTKIILWNALFVETFLLKGNLMFTSYLFMTLMFRNLNQTKRVKSTFRLVLVMFMINHL